MFYLVANSINFLLMKKICAVMAIPFIYSGKEKKEILLFS